jgi:DNA-binding MarR family transcriptional regulator
LTDREYVALARFRRSLRAFQAFSERAARAVGVAPAQHQLLLAVRGHEGAEAPVVGDLAEALQLRHHSTVELVDRAARAGLVERHADAGDHRRQHVELTDAGRTVLEQLSIEHRAELQRFRAGLTEILYELG